MAKPGEKVAADSRTCSCTQSVDDFCSLLHSHVPRLWLRETQSETPWRPEVKTTHVMGHVMGMEATAWECVVEYPVIRDQHIISNYDIWVCLKLED